MYITASETLFSIFPKVAFSMSEKRRHSISRDVCACQALFSRAFLPAALSRSGTAAVASVAAVVPAALRA